MSDTLKDKMPMKGQSKKQQKRFGGGKGKNGDLDSISPEEAALFEEEQRKLEAENASSVFESKNKPEDVKNSAEEALAVIEEEGAEESATIENKAKSAKTELTDDQKSIEEVDAASEEARGQIESEIQESGDRLKTIQKKIASKTEEKISPENKEKKESLEEMFKKAKTFIILVNDFIYKGGKLSKEDKDSLESLINVTQGGLEGNSDFYDDSNSLFEDYKGLIEDWEEFIDENLEEYKRISDKHKLFDVLEQSEGFYLSKLDEYQDNPDPNEIKTIIKSLQNRIKAGEDRYPNTLKSYEGDDKKQIGHIYTMMLKGLLREFRKLNVEAEEKEDQVVERMGDKEFGLWFNKNIDKVRNEIKAGLKEMQVDIKNQELTYHDAIEDFEKGIEMLENDFESTIKDKVPELLDGYDKLSDKRKLAYKNEIIKLFKSASEVVNDVFKKKMKDTNKGGRDRIKEMQEANDKTIETYFDEDGNEVHKMQDKNLGGRDRISELNKANNEKIAAYFNHEGTEIHKEKKKPNVDEDKITEEDIEKILKVSDKNSKKDAESVVKEAEKTEEVDKSEKDIYEQFAFFDDFKISGDIKVDFDSLYENYGAKNLAIEVDTSNDEKIVDSARAFMEDIRKARREYLKNQESEFDDEMEGNLLKVVEKALDKFLVRYYKVDYRNEMEQAVSEEEKPKEENLGLDEIQQGFYDLYKNYTPGDDIKEDHNKLIEFYKDHHGELVATESDTPEEVYKKALGVKDTLVKLVDMVSENSDGKAEKAPNILIGEVAAAAFTKLLDHFKSPVDAAEETEVESALDDKGTDELKTAQQILREKGIDITVNDLEEEIKIVFDEEEQSIRLENEKVIEDVLAKFDLGDRRDSVIQNIQETLNKQLDAEAEQELSKIFKHHKTVLMAGAGIGAIAAAGSATLRALGISTMTKAGLATAGVAAGGTMGGFSGIVRAKIRSCLSPVLSKLQGKNAEKLKKIKLDKLGEVTTKERLEIVAMQAVRNVALLKIGGKVNKRDLVKSNIQELIDSNKLDNLTEEEKEKLANRITLLSEISNETSNHLEALLNDKKKFFKSDVTKGATIGAGMGALSAVARSMADGPFIPAAVSGAAGGVMLGDSINQWDKKRHQENKTQEIAREIDIIERDRNASESKKISAEEIATLKSYLESGVLEKNVVAREKAKMLLIDELVKTQEDINRDKVDEINKELENKIDRSLLRKTAIYAGSIAFSALAGAGAAKAMQLAGEAGFMQGDINKVSAKYGVSPEDLKTFDNGNERFNYDEIKSAQSAVLDVDLSKLDKPMDGNELTMLSHLKDAGLSTERIEDIVKDGKFDADEAVEAVKEVLDQDKAKIGELQTYKMILENQLKEANGKSPKTKETIADLQKRIDALKADEAKEAAANAASLKGRAPIENKINHVVNTADVVVPAKIASDPEMSKTFKEIIGNNYDPENVKEIKKGSSISEVFNKRIAGDAKAVVVTPDGKPLANADINLVKPGDVVVEGKDGVFYIFNNDGTINKGDSLEGIYDNIEKGLNDKGVPQEVQDHFNKGEKGFQARMNVAEAKAAEKFWDGLSDEQQKQFNGLKHEAKVDVMENSSTMEPAVLKDALEGGGESDIDIINVDTNYRLSVTNKDGINVITVEDINGNPVSGDTFEYKNESGRDLAISQATEHVKKYASITNKLAGESGLSPARTEELCQKAGLYPFDGKHYERNLEALRFLENNPSAEEIDVVKIRNMFKENYSDFKYGYQDVKDNLKVLEAGEFTDPVKAEGIIDLMKAENPSQRLSAVNKIFGVKMSTDEIDYNPKNGVIKFGNVAEVVGRNNPDGNDVSMYVKVNEENQRISVGFAIPGQNNDINLTGYFNREPTDTAILVQGKTEAIMSNKGIRFVSENLSETGKTEPIVVDTAGTVQSESSDFVEKVAERNDPEPVKKEVPPVTEKQDPEPVKKEIPPVPEKQDPEPAKKEVPPVTEKQDSEPVKKEVPPVTENTGELSQTTLKHEIGKTLDDLKTSEQVISSEEATEIAGMVKNEKNFSQELFKTTLEEDMQDQLGKGYQMSPSAKSRIDDIIKDLKKSNYDAESVKVFGDKLNRIIGTEKNLFGVEGVASNEVQSVDDVSPEPAPVPPVQDDVADRSETTVPVVDDITNSPGQKLEVPITKENEGFDELDNTSPDTEPVVIAPGQNEDLISDTNESEIGEAPQPNEETNVEPDETVVSADDAEATTVESDATEVETDTLEIPVENTSASEIKIDTAGVVTSEAKSLTSSNQLVDAEKLSANRELLRSLAYKQAKTFLYDKALKVQTLQESGAKPEKITQAIKELLTQYKTANSDVGVEGIFKLPKNLLEIKGLNSTE